MGLSGPGLGWVVFVSKCCWGFFFLSSPLLFKERMDVVFVMKNDKSLGFDSHRTYWFHNK